MRTTNKYVLVTANSNSACDTLTERLIDVLQPDEIFRMFAKTYNENKIPEKIRPICNWYNGVFKFPSLEYLYGYRVVICTLTTAGCLTRSREIDTHFNSSHFDYIFTDEAACVQSAVSLIPIAGLCTERSEIKSNIIFAGDPHQLDAVVKSTYATELGLKTSFMENLFQKPCYKPNPTTHMRDSRYITQLTKNYRNHPEILKISNILFYSGMLEPLASTGNPIETFRIPKNNLIQNSGII